MKKELIVQKKKILKRISVKEYREILKFVEEVYLSDYPLKIMLARKSSNLYKAMIDLVLEEDGGRVRRLYREKFYNAKQEPLIISDRALEYYSEKIQKGDYKKILIVDDIIIHGRTIDQLYKKVVKLAGNNECNIDVRAFVANEGELLDCDHIRKANVSQRLHIDQWRYTIDRIVDLFYLSVEPYTSYIPNVLIKINSNLGCRVQDFMNQNIALSQDGLNQYSDFTSYAWVEEKHMPFCLFQSVRFYADSEINKGVLVPMVSLMPVDKCKMDIYVNILGDLYLDNYLEKIFPKYEELGYRAVIYGISALWGRYFIKNVLGYEHIDIPDEVMCEDELEETLNFGTRILDRNKLDALCVEDMNEYFKLLNETYQKEVIDSSFMKGMHVDFNELDNMAKKLFSYNKKEDVATLVSCFLHENGEMDEMLWKRYLSEKSSEFLRLMGYPLSCLVSLLKQLKFNLKEICYGILKAIDYGKGSIVAKVIEYEGNTYFFSLIHAGEQNYKYLENQYFCFIYGLYEIERIAEEKGINPSQYKSKLKDKYIHYLENKGMLFEEKEFLFLEKELDSLCKKNISYEYEAVLTHDIQFLNNREELNDIFQMVDATTI